MSGQSDSAKVARASQPAEPRLQCPICHATISALDFLAGVTKYLPAERTGEGFCPACRKALEFRFFGPRFELGYTYWAGALHFDALAEVWITGLELEHTENGCFAVVGERRFPMPTPSARTGKAAGA